MEKIIVLDICARKLNQEICMILKKLKVGLSEGMFIDNQIFGVEI